MMQLFSEWEASLLFRMSFQVHKQYSVILKLHGVNDKYPFILQN